MGGFKGNMCWPKSNSNEDTKQKFSIARFFKQFRNKDEVVKDDETTEMVPKSALENNSSDNPIVTTPLNTHK